MAVVGAGASGAEIASGYVRLGVKVMLFEALERVLPTEDADISKVVERGFKRQGIDVHTGTLVTDVKSTDQSVTFTYGEESGEVDWLVIAAGRGPDVEALGLEAAGVKLERQRPDRGRRRDAHERRGDLRDRRPRPGPRAGPQGLRRGRDRGRGRRRAATPTRSSTSTFPEPRSARRTSPASASPRNRRASRGTTSRSARSSTAPSARAPSTATAPG